MAASLSLSDDDLVISYSAVGGAETLNIGLEKRSSGGSYSFYAERTITSPGSSGTVTFESPEAGTYRGYGEECFEGDNCDPRITTNTVTIEEPPGPSIDISGLVVSINEGRSDSFSVTASNLEPKVAYRIRVSTDSSDIGFGSNCKQSDDSQTLSGTYSYTVSFTLMTCEPTRGTVTATLRQGNSNLVSDDEGVIVRNLDPTIQSGLYSKTYDEGETIPTVTT